MPLITRTKQTFGGRNIKALKDQFYLNLLTSCKNRQIGNYRSIQCQKYSKQDTNKNKNHIIYQYVFMKDFYTGCHLVRFVVFFVALFFLILIYAGLQYGKCGNRKEAG